MTKKFQKVLSILCAVALLVSGIAMAFADEANEAPVTDEAAQLAAEEAARIAAEEEAARIAAAEAEAARIAAEEEAARIAAAEAEAARIAAEEEAARIAAAEAEAARIAAEEEAARIAAEEEAARIAAEEEAARIAAAEAEAARIAAEEEAARIEAEQAAASSEDENDGADENGLVEIDDGWGYVDPDIISENTPEITDELKGIRNVSMNVNETLTDTVSFGEELVISLKCGKAGTVDLTLYTSGNVNVKVDGKAVGFTPAGSDGMSTYTLENTAGRTRKIVLTTNDTVSFRLDAVEKQTEVQEVTPGTGETAQAEENTEEPAPSEEHNEAETENAGSAEAANAAGSAGNSENSSTGSNTAAIVPAQPSVPAEPTIQVSMKTYSALKAGSSISDSLLGGQKAKFQVKCGKNDNVKLVLNANPDDLIVRIDGSDAQFSRIADGTYTLDLNGVAFRKFTILLTAKQDLAFTMSAEAIETASEAGETATGSGETAAEEDEKEDSEEENSGNDINNVETESADGQEAEENGQVLADISAEADENTEAAENNTEENAEGANDENAEAPEAEAEEEPADEGKTDGFKLPENCSVSFTINWDNGKATLGAVAHFKATIIGYEGLDYRIQWQQSTDNNTWVDIEGENEKTMDILANEETNKLFYRVIVIVNVPGEDTNAEPEVQPEA